MLSSRLEWHVRKARTSLGVFMKNAFKWGVDYVLISQFLFHTMKERSIRYPPMMLSTTELDPPFGYRKLA